MGLKLHIICAKCGSDDIHFQIIDRDVDELSGVYIICENCSELTSVEEWNEFNNKVEYNQLVSEKK
jgi:protein-arginine kinase activator protein McsA